ncbi:hypothetical protein OAA91_01185 [Fibrobacterales bacterium]|nr:hypothetical protein [Fibrobacterales bacterium]
MNYLKSTNPVFFSCVMIFFTFLFSQCSRVTESEIVNSNSTSNIEDIQVGSFDFKTNQKNSVSIQLDKFHKRLPVKLNVFVLEEDETKKVNQVFSNPNGEINFDLTHQNHHSKVVLEFITHRDTIKKTMDISEISDFTSLNLEPNLAQGDL